MFEVPPMTIDQAELVALLDELLEAERAGARVTLESVRTAADAPTAALLMAIKAAGKVPSTKVGAFYGKAMAIADLGERIVFLNRGQGWVVRKLRDMLTRVGDDSLRADLTEMLRSHEDNIALANKAVGQGG
jgi:nitronate monooxygenase